MIVLHPNWVAKAGVGDIVRHFDVRGFDVSNIVGSRFFTVKPKPAPTHVVQRGFSTAWFRVPGK